MVAAYTVGLLIDCQKNGTAFDTGWIWKCIVLQVVLVLLRFFFDYLRARYQESISYELTARDRLAVGGALKRVSLGYFQQMSTGYILNSLILRIWTGYIGWFTERSNRAGFFCSTWSTRVLPPG